MKRNKLVTTIVVCGIAVVVLVGGYFALRGAMNATMSATGSQTVTTTSYPATPVPAAPSPSTPCSYPPVDLQVAYRVSSGDATPQPQDLSADHAAQAVAQAAHCIFGVDAQGASVAMTYQTTASYTITGQPGSTPPAVVYWTTSDGGNVAVTQDGQTGTPGETVVVTWSIVSGQSWTADLTTTSGQKVTATIDAVTGQVRAMANAFPKLAWTCGDAIPTPPVPTPSTAEQQAQQAVQQAVQQAMLVADFIAKLSPTSQVFSSTTKCVADSGYQMIEFSMADGSAYLVSVDASGTAYDFRYFSDSSLVTVPG